MLTNFSARILPILIRSNSHFSNSGRRRERERGHGSLYQFQDIKRILMNLRRNVFRSPPIYCLFPTRPIQFPASGDYYMQARTAGKSRRDSRRAQFEDPNPLKCPAELIQFVCYTQGTMVHIG